MQRPASKRVESCGVHPAPTWFRYGLAAICTLILCSCQAAGPVEKGSSAIQLGPQGLQLPSNQAARVQPATYLAADLPVVASSQRFAAPAIYQRDPNTAPPWERQAQYAAGVCSGCPCGSCSACGCGECGGVGPRDEYLCDGGDQGLPAGVKADWQITGLEQEDTVAHYDTVDGRTLVTASNQVCLYAPRFGVVRRVVDLQEYARYDSAVGFNQAAALAKIDESEEAATSLNKLGPKIDRAEDPSSLLRERQQPGELGRERRLAAEVGTLAPYADLQIVLTGVITGTEQAKIARAALAAITWTGDESPQISVDSRNAIAAVSDRQPGIVYHLEEPNKPCLRLIKLASSGSAQPGEEVEFTLRLDNVGNREMGNVTVVDNLTTRLEYVPESAKASVPADFSTAPNSNGSEVLRWELKDPLAAGAGCVVQFKCRVR